MATISQKKSMISVCIESVGGMGDGVGFIDRKPCFVPHTVPGDVVEIHILRENRKQCKGRVVNILEAGPSRREPTCSLAGVCGGCSWLHMGESEQLAVKKGVLSKALALDDVTMVPSVKSLGYRRLARLHLVPQKRGAPVLGFSRQSDRNIVDLDACPILEEQLSRSLAPLKAGPLSFVKERLDVNLALGKGGVSVFLQTTDYLDPAFYTAVRELDEDLFAGVVVNVAGVRTVVRPEPLVETDGVDGAPLFMPAGSFGQANGSTNQSIVELVAKWVKELGDIDSCIELFGGAGNFSVCLAGLVKKLQVVEFDKEACKVARHNLKIRNAHNVVVHCGDAVEMYGDYGRDAQVVVLDPPRIGSKDLAKEMADGDHRAIVYVSCNPQTLARDIQLLAEGGFQLTKAMGFDMFPQTPHMEAVVLLERQ